MTDRTYPETETPEFLYARDLLVSFVEEHCDPVPEWKPNIDLMGILMQFDNALTVVRSIKAGFDPKQPRDHAQNSKEPIAWRWKPLGGSWQYAESDANFPDGGGTLQPLYAADTSTVRPSAFGCNHDMADITDAITSPTREAGK